MAIKYELSAKNGTYEKDGQEKTRYLRCGVVLETRNGLAAKIECLPVAFDGWLYLNEPRAKDAPKEAAKPSRNDLPDDGFEDSIPF